MDIVEVQAYSEPLLVALNRLMPQLSENVRPLTEAHLRSIVASACTRLFMARHHGQYVGTMSLVFFELPTGLRVRLEDLAVDAPFQGKGWGRRLVAHAIATACLAGAKALDLTSNPNRAAANALYVKMGFEYRPTHVYLYPLAATSPAAQ